MFAPPWKRFAQRNIRAGAAEYRERSRSRSRGRPDGTPVSSAETAIAHARQLCTLVSPQVLQPILGSMGVDVLPVAQVCAAPTGNSNIGVDVLPVAQVCAAPTGSTNNANNAVVWAAAAIAWLESPLGQAAPRADIDWRFATARIRLHAAHTTPQIHLALGTPAATLPRWSSRSGPPPRMNLRLLEQHAQASGDPGLAMDGVFAARTTAAHADGTHNTYASHVNMIGWACKILKADQMPARLLTIQRVTGVVNDPSTLRGWLAAWKLAHDIIGHPWLGDIDPRLRMDRVGVGRLAPPAQPRKRARRSDTICIVQYALSQATRKWVIWGGHGCLRLRVWFPSAE